MDVEKTGGLSGCVSRTDGRTWVY